MKKVEKKCEGVYVPLKEYCDKKEQDILKKLSMCPNLGGEISWSMGDSPLSRIDAETELEAGDILDTRLKEFIENATIPELKARENCSKCPVFDRCAQMKLLSLLEEISYKLTR